MSWLPVSVCAALAPMLLAGGCCRPPNEAEMMVFSYDKSELLIAVSVSTSIGVQLLKPTITNGFEADVPIPPDGVYLLEGRTASGRVIRGDCVARVAPRHVLLVALDRFDPLRIRCADAGRD